ncbi:uncharacterized protein LOC133297608 [Gastrolobium bilobum]|uniref:uncharacterized protein LOC133297608 n=1 Tax=Gastrolobium bilobum TaxID=150636 RepID=UPI002AB1E2C6|nr:uncharacterized protein LOC133297608 [Gastrolobium bilobum]
MEECNQSVDDPFCPSYRFEKEIHKESCKPWRMAIIVKLLGKRVGVKFFQNRLLKMWNLSGSYEFIDMENDYFLFRFDKIEDYNFVLQEGPWVVADHYVMVQRWRPFFNPHDDDFKKLVVWLRIPGLPIEFYTSRHLCNIGNLFGRTLKIDRNSIRKDIIGDKEFTDRAKFARICVEVDLRKGFLSKFKIGNRVFPVGYEGLHLVCFACGRYGHRRDSCPTLAPASTSTINQSTQIHTTMANTTVQHKVAMEGEAFGSWMLVQRNQRGRKKVVNSAMDAAIKEKAHEVHSIPSKKSAPGKSSNIPDLNQLTIMDTSAQNIPQPAKHMGKRNQEDQLLQNGSVKVSRKNKQQIPKKTGAVKESFVLKKKQTGLAVSSKSFKLPSKPQSLSRESKERIFLSLTKGDTNMFLNDIARNVNPSPSSNLALSSISGKQENGQLLERGQQNGKILIPDEEFKETNEPPDALVKSVLGNQAHNNLVDSDGASILGDLKGLEKRAFPPNKRPHKKISYLYLSAFGNPYWWTACKAGGIWILWNSSEVNIQVLHTDHQFIHSKISWLNYHKQEFFTFVYASPRRQERHALWDALENIQPQNNNEWCIMGDFNTYIHSEEKRGSSVHNWRSMQDFQDCLMSCHLSDLGHQGPSFSWRRGNLLERLDRACVNQSWNMSFPNRVISHLPFYNSDHRPILLWDGQPNFSNGGARPFRFLAAWLTHNSFSDLVKRCWAGGHNWKASSENFREKATSWHKDCYKEEEKLKNNLHSRLRGIDYSLSQHPCHSLERLQKEIWQQLNTIYLREEITWYQRSRTDWIRFGDRNTKFFHSATVARRRRNRIDALQNDVGDWIADPSLLMSMAVEYYDNLYKEDIPLRPNFPIRNKFPEMERRVMMALESCPSSQEIKGVVFSMGPFKAPGVDGLHSIFFQSQWDVVESSVCNFIKGVFNDPSRIEEVNQTLLCLIPKL